MVNEPKQAYLNPNTWGFTIGVIVMVCLVPFGDYYSMDSPGAMEFYVKESMTGFTKDANGTAQKLNQDEYGNLYAIYSFPNIFLCIVGGYILDSVLGRRKGTFVFAAIVTIGQLLVTVAAKYNSIVMMYCGRFLFGIGAESLALGEYAYNTYWFDRTKVSKNSPYQPKIGLSTAFGIAISITRGATFFAFNTLGPIYESVAGKDVSATETENLKAWNSWNDECNGSNQTDVCPVTITVVDCEAGYTKDTVPFDIQYNVDSNATATAFFTAFMLAAFSLLVSVILGFVDIRGNRWRKANPDSETLPLTKEGQEKEETMVDDEDISPVTFADVKKISLAAWLIFLICGFYYMSVFPFVSTGVEYLKIYHGAADASAKFWAPLIVVLSGCGFALVFGTCVDTFMHNIIWLMAGIGCTGAGHLFLTLKVFPWQWNIIAMGIGYALVASSLWPLLAYNVNKKITGTAYGLMQAFQSLCLMAAYKASGLIVDSYVEESCDGMNSGNCKDECLLLTGQLNGYAVVGWFYVVCCGAGIACCVWMIMIVGVHGGADKKEDGEE